MIRAIAPVSCFHVDSSARSCRSGSGESVILELALQVFACTLPLRRDPAFALQSVEGRIERSMLDLKHVICGSLDVLCDLVAVSLAKQECAEDQHVERSLQQFDSVGGFFRHSASRHSTQISVTVGRRPTEILVSEQ
jgi:hypothetical protein